MSYVPRTFEPVLVTAREQDGGFPDTLNAQHLRSAMCRRLLSRRDVCEATGLMSTELSELEVGRLTFPEHVWKEFLTRVLLIRRAPETSSATQLKRERRSRRFTRTALLLMALLAAGCGQQPTARAASFVTGGGAPTTPEGPGYFDDRYGVFYGPAAWCEVTVHCAPEAVAVAEGMPTPKVPWYPAPPPNATPCG